MLTPLTPDEIARALASLPGWSLELNALTRSFNLGSFRDAMSFMGRIAFEAEELNHHPEWTNVYDRVVIRLNTHDVGGVVTARDVALALRIQRIAEKGAGISSLAAERG
jgi:4a-hydroxytetrahydrobiopterin dehydratase